ncbi:CAP domain-containing protein [Fictibacillus sp. Mic-4]|uniref:CAP domain-containing protein n=1 Tax=Fictibacillus TaxID=1329200 RepID=UPI00047DE1FB|nr:CAP domain-containing protein [Fictibacillus gelatini]
MKKIIVAIIVLILALFWLLDINIFPSTEKSIIKHEQVKPEINNPPLKVPASSVAKLIGQSKDELIKKLGDPVRIDPSSYGYDWYIYSQNPNTYMQVGVKDEKVITIYAIGKKLPIKPFAIGEPSTKILHHISVTSDVTVKDNDNFYRFELSEEEMNVRPLVKVGNIWIQLYIDKFTQRLSSIRFMTKDVLLMQRPYSIVYRGELMNPPEYSDEEERLIEQAEEKQILDVTNVIRLRHHLKPVVWHEKAAEVAFSHSKEMVEKNYFSHVSPTEGDLANRFNKAHIKYTEAAENIAANYTDGPAAVEGWLNSEGHRKALLNKNYTHLGVGVYKKDYTQNFLTP